MFGHFRTEICNVAGNVTIINSYFLVLEVIRFYHVYTKQNCSAQHCCWQNYTVQKLQILYKTYGLTESSMNSFAAALVAVKT